MTDRAAELEAVLRVWDSDSEIGNAAVAATTFHGANGASGANFVVEVMLLS
jgi:hypothetical protein